MSLSQQKFREIVFQILYSYDMCISDEEEINRLLMKELSVTRNNVRDAQHRVQLVQQELVKIDDLITKITSSYDFSRIQRVERNVLRLGVYELLYDKEIPPKVAIAEAMRLARKFSTPEAGLFVNAIMDSIYKQEKGETVDTKAIEETYSMLKESEEIANDAAITKEKDADEMPTELPEE